MFIILVPPFPLVLIICNVGASAFWIFATLAMCCCCRELLATPFAYGLSGERELLFRTDFRSILGAGLTGESSWIGSLSAIIWSSFKAFGVGSFCLKSFAGSGPFLLFFTMTASECCLLIYIGDLTPRFTPLLKVPLLALGNWLDTVSMLLAIPLKDCSSSFEVT